MGPRSLKYVGILPTLYSRSTDKAGQGACRIRAAGKTEDVDFVIGFIVVDNKFVDLLNDLLETQPDRSAEELLGQIPIDAYAVMIMDQLFGAIASHCFDAGAHSFSAIKLGDIRVGAAALFVPRPINQDSDPLHRPVSRAASCGKRLPQVEAKSLREYAFLCCCRA